MCDVHYRLDTTTYFMVVAFAASLRSTCERRAVGAVLVKDKRIISTGYNGSPAGFEHCTGSANCQFNKGGCIRTIHAEMNCITRARETGDILYCTDKPCLSCLKTILSHNPKIEIYYARDYNDEAREEYLRMNGASFVSIEQINQHTLKRIKEIIPHVATD